MSRKNAIREYVRCLAGHGWEKAESVKMKYRKTIADFDKIADAAAISLRTVQLLSK